MKPKKKYGFASYISTSLPRKDYKPPEVLGELLPNGFRVGEKVWYYRENIFSGIKELRVGKVLKHRDNTTLDVWCYWFTPGDPTSHSYHPTYTSRFNVKRISDGYPLEEDPFA
jgi:hypothetical protein